jgi:hypothetical protein
MKEKSSVAARQRGESELPSWLESSDAEFLKIARKLLSARGKAERDRLLREGLGGKFAARLLRDSERQVECWKFVGQLCADKAWRPLFRNTGATGAPLAPQFPWTTSHRNRANSAGTGWQACIGVVHPCVPHSDWEDG